MKKWAAAGRFIGVGWYIAVCIVLGIWLGMKLDQLIHTKLIFTIVGLLGGLLLAFWGVYQLLLPLMEQKSREDRRGR